MKTSGHNLKNACLKRKVKNNVTLHHLAQTCQSHIKSSSFSLLSPCPKQGNCAENTAKNNNITREEQDTYAISSYSRSKAAYQAGVLAKEIVSVSIPQRGNSHLSDHGFTLPLTASLMFLLLLFFQVNLMWLYLRMKSGGAWTSAKFPN